MSKLTALIEASGKYCKVKVSGGEVTGMLVDEDYRYDSATNTGGRRLIGYQSELESEYGVSSAARELGAKGGASKSPAKKAASASNGRKGGRPATGTIRWMNPATGSVDTMENWEDDYRLAKESGEVEEGGWENFPKGLVEVTYDGHAWVEKK